MGDTEVTRQIPHTALAVRLHEIRNRLDIVLGDLGRVVSTGALIGLALVCLTHTLPRGRIVAQRTNSWAATENDLMPRIGLVDWGPLIAWIAYPKLKKGQAYMLALHG
jgi:hypothetical protein